MLLKDCPVSAAIDIIGGKWKPMILYHLMDGKKRFSELRKLVPEATQKMLTQQLRELERDGVIARKVYPTVPPRVEYSFTSGGRSLRTALKALCTWSNSFREETGDRRIAVRIPSQAVAPGSSPSSPPAAAGPAAPAASAPHRPGCRA